MSEIQYWDVFPRCIKVTQDSAEVIIPLSIRGELSTEPVFESAQPWIASVTPSGRVQLGAAAGATMILVYDSEARTSVRYVQVEVAPAETRDA